MGARLAFVNEQVALAIAASRGAQLRVQCRFYLEVGVAQSGWAAIAGASRFGLDQ
jgi:hypothetical protein